MNLETCLVATGMGVTAVFMVYLLGQVKSLKVQARTLEASLAHAATAHLAPAAPVSKAAPAQVQSPTDIADYMTKLQRHANKLYFAGKLGNWPLADFYVEEI